MTPTTSRPAWIHAEVSVFSAAATVNSFGEVGMTSASAYVQPASQNITAYSPEGMSGTWKEAVACARFDSGSSIAIRPTRRASAFPTDHQSCGALLRIARSTIE
jgi:hypothetical protein